MDTILFRSANMFKNVSSETILFNNLGLMGFDFTKASKDLHTTIGTGCFEKENQKTAFYIIYSILSKLCDEEDMKSFIGYYPPRSANDAIEYKKIALDLLSKLEKRSRIPKNFVTGKSILDSCKGQRFINFLRFLSEFALRNCFLLQFPQSNMKVFNMCSLTSMRGKKDHQLHDISDIYAFNSEDKEIKISQKNIALCLQHCFVNIIIERKKLKKKMNKYAHYTMYIQEQADQLQRSYQSERKLHLQLQQEYAIIKEIIPRGLLSEMRQLDRIPQIDLIREVYREVNEIYTNLETSDLVNKLTQFCEDGEKQAELSVITKETLGICKKDQDEQNGGSLVHISQIYNKFNESLAQADQQIDKKQSQEALQLHDTLLNKLKEAQRTVTDNDKLITELQQKVHQKYQGF